MLAWTDNPHTQTVEGGRGWRRRAPVDFSPYAINIKRLWVLRRYNALPSSIARRTARRLLWARSMEARDGAPMQWRAAGRDTPCRRSRKATQDNLTSDGFCIPPIGRAM